MNQVSDRLAALAPSQTLAMSQKSSELKAQGVDVINLSVGEPDFNTPQHIKDAAKKAIDDNFSHYSPVPGYMDLRQAICAKLKNENGLDFTPEQIVVSNGAKQSICNTILALVNPGDEVILPAPYWVSYVEMVKLAEGKNVIIETGIEQDFKMTPAQLEAAITPKTKLLILCSPSNPTGSVYSREELEALASVLERHPQVFVISDEIYEHINYVGAHQSLAQFPSIRERIVIINGVSKGYAMTGWRIGYAAGPENVIRNMVKLQENVSACAATPCQVAAIEALEGPQDHLKYMVEQYRGCRFCRRARLRRNHETSISTPSRFGRTFGKRNTRTKSKRSAGSILSLPRGQPLFREVRRRTQDKHLFRFGDVYPRSRSCCNGGGRCFRGSRLSSSVLCYFRGEYHRSHAPYERSPRPFEVRPAKSGSVEKQKG